MVVSNVDAKPHHVGHEWTALLSAQLASPVRWKHCAAGHRRISASPCFAELGPGGVLTGMAKRSVDAVRTIAVATPDDLDKLVEWLGGATRRIPTPPDSKASTCSPSSGWWCRRPPASSPRSNSSTGHVIEVGDVIGHVGELRGPLTVPRCVLQSFIAVDTERVTSRQPIAWLRTD